MVYAVIDTNVFIPALITKNQEAATVKVLEAVFRGDIIPLYHDTGEILADMDDLVFYEVAMEKRGDDPYLVTGNQKHYPIKEFVVTPFHICLPGFSPKHSNTAHSCE